MSSSGASASRSAFVFASPCLRTSSWIIVWIDEVFAEHRQESLRYVNGERKLQGVLVGLVMKKSKGKADPKKLNQLLAARVTGG